VDCHFHRALSLFIPFFLLLIRSAKKRRRILASIAACVFAAHIVAIWWTIAPSVYTKHLYVGWLAPAAFLGIGGIYSFAFLKNLERRRLIPLNDPRLALAVPT